MREKDKTQPERGARIDEQPPFGDAKGGSSFNEDSGGGGDNSGGSSSGGDDGGFGGRRVTTCSFCGKTSREVGPMVEGPNEIYVCSNCTDL